VEEANLTVAEVPMQKIGFWKRILHIFKK